MPLSRAITALLLLAVIAAPQTAQAKKKRKLVEERVVKLEYILLPDVVAERIEGSGIECRSLATVGGARHKMQLAKGILNLGPRLSMRAGIGIAKMAPLPLAPERDGLVAAAGVTYTLWRTDGYSADVDLAALQARYDSGAITDASVLLMFRRR